MRAPTLHLHTAFRIGAIDPRLFGGFLEHMGRAVYEGVYDPTSAHADANGFRCDVLDALRRLRFSAVRYPGNFLSAHCYVGDWTGDTCDYLAVTNHVARQVEEVDAVARAVQARANLTQVVNLIAPVLTRGDDLLLPSTFFPFEMVSRRRDGVALRVAVDGPTYRSTLYGEVSEVDGSAILDGDRLHVFATNRSLDEEAALTVAVADRGVVACVDAELLGGPVAGGQQLRAAGRGAGDPVRRRAGRGRPGARRDAAAVVRGDDPAPRVRRLAAMRPITCVLALLLAAATPAGAASRGARPRPAPPARSATQAYPGFGYKTTGGAGRPTFTVTTLADAGPGSLRDALGKAAQGGGTIRFAVGGGITLESGLDVPGRTTIDGSSAPAPGVTLWGARTGARGTGVLNLAESNVVLRGLRIRDAGNDGVHIAPQRRRPVANIVVDHCSITNSGDGGVDVTGRDGLPVTDVTIVANYLAGNGGSCQKGLCGGGSLANQGATRLSYYFNLWDRNLRRTPSVVGPDAVADVRYNVIRETEQGSIQIRDGARANLVGNTLEGRRGQTAAVELWGGRAHVDDTPSDVTRQSAIAALPAPRVPSARAAPVVIREAGALPRDAVDRSLVERAGGAASGGRAARVTEPPG